MALAFLRHHQARIVDMLYERIHQTTQADAYFVPNELRDNIARGAAAFLSTLEANDPTAIDHFITDLIAPRTVEEFPLAVLHRTFTVFGEMLLPLLRECYGDDTGRILDDLQRLHLLIAAILQKLVEQYETRSKVLVRCQQEQLRAYSQQLEAHLVQVGEEFQTLQDFNESILQSMSSGLLVADKDTHRILKVNHAMERLSGLPATAVVGNNVGSGFAWNHGDIQPEIARTYIGIVGPGVKKLGVTSPSDFFTDHVDLRPTLMMLTGLTDDYQHDGRVISEILDESALPNSLKAHKNTLESLGQVYKQINAPFGQLAQDTLKISTYAITSTSAGDAVYNNLEGKIADWTSVRDGIAAQIHQMLEGAEFGGVPIDKKVANQLIGQSQELLEIAKECVANLAKCAK